MLMALQLLYWLHGKIALRLANIWGETALMEAVRTNGTEIVKLLLSAVNINVNKASNRGDTALILAAGNGDVKIVKLILTTLDIDANKADQYDNTALMFAAHK